MIRTEAEYARAKERLGNDQAYLEQLKAALSQADLSGEEVERAMQPALSFHAQLVEEVETYERMRRGQFDSLSNLTGIGRWLIGLRIYRGWTQKRLAEVLRVSETQVSKDERNEYHNVSTEKAQRILHALGANFSMRIEDLTPDEHEPTTSAS